MFILYYSVPGNTNLQIIFINAIPQNTRMPISNHVNRSYDLTTNINNIFDIIWNHMISQNWLQMLFPWNKLLNKSDDVYKCNSAKY